MKQPNGVIAALDSQAGGTWMGMNTHGRLAALTNVRTRTPLPETKQSRGQMVVNSLNPGSGTPDALLPDHEAKAYFAYHLVTCKNVFDDPPSLECEHCVPCSQRPPGSSDQPTERHWSRVYETISDSRWACSNEGGNGHISASKWPKTTWLQREAAALVCALAPDIRGEEGARHVADLLGNCLSTSNSWTEEELPDMSFSPEGEARERALQNGPYIDPTVAGALSNYGTQSQTIVIRSVSARCVYYFYRSTQGLSV